MKLNLQKPGHFSVHDTASTSSLLQGFCSPLFPLIIETWVEALANEQLNKNQGKLLLSKLVKQLIFSLQHLFSCSGCSLIGPETMELFASITNVMFTLWSIMNQSDDRKELLNWFQQQCGEALIRHFLQRFPFSPRIETNRNKKQSGDLNCREHNLIVCFLWAQLQMKNTEKFAKPIFQYLSGNCFNSPSDCASSTHVFNFS